MRRGKPDFLTCRQWNHVDVLAFDLGERKRSMADQDSARLASVDSEGTNMSASDLEHNYRTSRAMQLEVEGANGPPSYLGSDARLSTANAANRRLESL